jgi:hypothetical protein
MARMSVPFILVSLVVAQTGCGPGRVCCPCTPSNCTPACSVQTYQAEETKVIASVRTYQGEEAKDVSKESTVYDLPPSTSRSLQPIRPIQTLTHRIDTIRR